MLLIRSSWLKDIWELCTIFAIFLYISKYFKMESFQKVGWMCFSFVEYHLPLFPYGNKEVFYLIAELCENTSMYYEHMGHSSSNTVGASNVAVGLNLPWTNSVFSMSV